MCENPEDGGIIISGPSIKHTHQCQKCQTKFKAYSPGCPICGSGAKVLPINSNGHNIDHSVYKGLD